MLCFFVPELNKFLYLHCKKNIMKNTSIVNYMGDLRTEAIHVYSKTKIITDAPLDKHGKAEAFSPTDLLATSLASCLLTDCRNCS